MNIELDEEKAKTSIQPKSFGGSRLIHPVTMRSFSQYCGVSIEGKSIDGVEIVSEGALKPDNLVMRFPFSGDPKGNVQPTVAIAPGIDDSTCVGFHCMEVANMISGNTAYVMNLLEASFFG